MNMLDRIARALAEADGGAFQATPDRYRRLALAALQPLASPTEAMIDAAHAAASFDDAWAINNRRDFRRAVEAMLTQSAVSARMDDVSGAGPALNPMVANALADRPSSRPKPPEAVAEGQPLQEPIRQRQSPVRVPRRP